MDQIKARLPTIATVRDIRSSRVMSVQHQINTPMKVVNIKVARVSKIITVVLSNHLLYDVDDQNP